MRERRQGTCLVEGNLSGAEVGGVKSSLGDAMTPVTVHTVPLAVPIAAAVCVGVGVGVGGVETSVMAWPPSPGAPVPRSVLLLLLFFALVRLRLSGVSRRAPQAAAVHAVGEGVLVRARRSQLRGALVQFVLRVDVLGPREGDVDLVQRAGEGQYGHRERLPERGEEMT